MAKKQSHGAKERISASALAPVHHQPGSGLTVSTKSRFPTTIADKLICAKSVIQAVRAAHDTGALDCENYDMSWPLSVAIDLLEEASEEFSKADDRTVR